MSESENSSASTDNNNVTPTGSNAAPTDNNAVAADSSVSVDDRNLALLAHLLGILTGFLGSLVIWMMHKDKPEKGFVNDQAKEALNFQITMLIAWVVVFLLCFVAIGLFLTPAIFIVNILFCVLGGLAAKEGKRYRYPIALRLIS